MKTSLRVWAVMLVMSIGSALAGCGGGGAEVRTQSTTLGQELKDLDDSYKKGIINEKQYEELKKSLIEQRAKR